MLDTLVIGTPMLDALLDLFLLRQLSRQDVRGQVGKFFIRSKTQGDELLDGYLSDARFEFVWKQSFEAKSFFEADEPDVGAEAQHRAEIPFD